MCANSLVNTAAKIYQYVLGLQIMEKAREIENRSSLSNMSTSRHCSLLWKISGRDMFDDNGVSLENSDRIRMEVLSSSLTKDQCYLYRRGYASNFLQGQTQVTLKQASMLCKHFEASVAPESPPPKLQKSKCVEVILNKHWGSTISHYHSPYAVNYFKYILCVMHIPLPIHPVWSALSLAKISSHLQYLWIIQNDAFAIDFISPL